MLFEDILPLLRAGSIVIRPGDAGYPGAGFKLDRGDIICFELAEPEDCENWSPCQTEILDNHWQLYVPWEMHE